MQASSRRRNGWRPVIRYLSTVLSQLCIPLWADERGLGTLSLYAADPSAFTDLDERITAMFATLAALTLADALRAEQMRAAVLNRDLIGQAMGILMERHRITADAAFALLAAASQHQNVKLTDFAPTPSKQAS
jgi:GAF domain-containing protein